MVSQNKTLREIRLHLNNAGSSLATQQPKYAPEGLTSAITAGVLCDNLLDDELDPKTKREVEQFREQAYKLINSYWEDYRMVLKDRPVDPHEIERKNNNSARRIVPEELKLEAMLEADKYPPGTPNRTKLFEEIGKKYGIAGTTLYTWMKERG